MSETTQRLDSQLVKMTEDTQARPCVLKWPTEFSDTSTKDHKSRHSISFKIHVLSVLIDIREYRSKYWSNRRRASRLRRKLCRPSRWATSTLFLTLPVNSVNSVTGAVVQETNLKLQESIDTQVHGLILVFSIVRYPHPDPEKKRTGHVISIHQHIHQWISMTWQHRNVFFFAQVTDLAGQTEKHFDQLEHTVEHKEHIHHITALFCQFWRWLFWQCFSWFK